MQNFLDSDSSSDEDVGIIKTEEAEMLLVSRSQFIDCIEMAQLSVKKNKIHFFADKLIGERDGIGENILLGDIEDYALGFK